MRTPRPAAFRKVKTGGATDRVVNPGVLHRRQEFGDDKTGGRLDEMLTERPPAEIIQLLNFRVRAFKKRNFFLQPVP